MTTFALPAQAITARQACLTQPMPTADPAAVRAAARRLADNADTLRRVATVLTGTAANCWTGTAAQAFARSMHANAPRVQAAASRYDQYALALTAYAGALDVLAPRLRILRHQLQDHPTAGDPAVIGLAADFWDTHRRWADALNRCTHALRHADTQDHYRDPHGWARLTHDLAQLASSQTSVWHAIENPSLAHLSAALGTLATDLTVAAVALLFICPPAAGACLTLATVLTAAQTALDVTRRLNGEHVTTSQISLDALGAIPILGRTGLEAKETLTVAEKIAPHERDVIDTARGTGLDKHEGLIAPGYTEPAHTLARHVGKSNAYLDHRLLNSSKPVVSTFYDLETAERALTDLLRDQKPALDAWLSSGDPQLRLKWEAPYPVGFLVSKGNLLGTSGRSIRVIVRRNSVLDTGYHIHTAMVFK